MGDQNAQNAQAQTGLSVYSPFGWYTDQYLLLSSASGELYVAAPNNSQAKPQKVANFVAGAAVGVGYGGL